MKYFQAGLLIVFAILVNIFTFGLGKEALRTGEFKTQHKTIRKSQEPLNFYFTVGCAFVVGPGMGLFILKLALDTLMM